METPIEAYILAYLKEEGFEADLHPTISGSQCSSAGYGWFLVVRVKPQLMVSVTDGIIRLEGFKEDSLLGEWELADPESFDRLASTLHDFRLAMGRHPVGSLRVAMQKWLAWKERYLRLPVLMSQDSD